MKNFILSQDPMILIFVILPIINLVYAIILNLVLKNINITTLLCSLIYTFLTFFVFNSTFFIWAVFYTIEVYIIGYLINKIKKMD